MLDTGIVTAPEGTAMIHALTLCSVEGDESKCQQLDSENMRGIVPYSLQALDAERRLPAGS